MMRRKIIEETILFPLPHSIFVFFGDSHAIRGCKNGQMDGFVNSWQMRADKITTEAASNSLAPVYPCTVYCCC